MRGGAGVRDNSFFRSAVFGDDGEVDSGYLSMFWALIGWSVNNLLILIVASLVANKENGAAVIQATGVALGANAGGFAAVLGAVGLFRMGDKPRAGVATSTATLTASGPAATPPSDPATPFESPRRGFESVPAPKGKGRRRA